MGQELAGDAAVLGQDRIDPGQDFERPDRDIAQIADRSRDHMQAARGARRVELMAANEEVSR
jgi:hypothetical protein